MSFSKTFIIVLVTILFSGCATLRHESASKDIQRNQCIISTSVVGLVAGSIAASPLASGIGLGAGNILGNYFCEGVGNAPTVAAKVDSVTGYFWPDDQDRDGVLDVYDACPFTPDGIVVDSDGCANDNDGDGVPDYLDQCPETPLGTVVDLNGCSFALVILKDVHFAFDSDRLTHQAKTILDQSIHAIETSVGTIQIEGHTDSTGPDSYNLDLSQRRAQSVQDYLVTKGISSTKLNATGYGENAPVSANDTASNRAQNRRVEIFAR